MSETENKLEVQRGTVMEATVKSQWQTQDIVLNSNTKDFHLTKDPEVELQNIMQPQTHHDDTWKSLVVTHHS